MPVENLSLTRDVVLYGREGRGPPVYGSNYSKSKVGPLNFLKQKEPKIALGACAPPLSKYDYAPKDWVFFPAFYSYLILRCLKVSPPIRLKLEKIAQLTFQEER